MIKWMVVTAAEWRRGLVSAHCRYLVCIVVETAFARLAVVHVLLAEVPVNTELAFCFRVSAFRFRLFADIFVDAHLFSGRAAVLAVLACGLARRNHRMTHKFRGLL